MRAKQLFPNNATPNEDGMERFYAASMILQKRALAYACMLLQMEIVWTSKIPTAGTDGVHVYINPEFFLELPNDEQRAFLLGHEIGHVVLRHPERGTFYKKRGFHSMQGADQIGWDAHIWNVAADYVINDDLKATHLQPIPSGLYKDSVSRDDLVDEVYIREWLDQPEEHEGPEPGGESGEGQPGGAESDEGQPDPSDEQSGDQPGEDSDESDESGSDGDDADTSEEPEGSGHGGFDDHFEPVYEGEDEEDVERQREEDREEIQERIKDASKQAEEQSKSIGRGTGSSIFDHSRNNDLTPACDWRHELAERVTRCGGAGASDWSRINRRRYAVTGILTPQHKGIMTRMAVVVDISWSVSRSALEDALMVVGHSIDTLQPTNGCAILWTNTQVVGVNEVFSGAELLDLEIPSGGGTELAPALDRIDEEGWDDADVILVFTDCDIPFSDMMKFAERDAIIVLTSHVWSGTMRDLEETGVEYIVAVDDVLAA